MYVLEEDESHRLLVEHWGKAGIEFYFEHPGPGGWVSAFYLWDGDISPDGVKRLVQWLGER